MGWRLMEGVRVMEWGMKDEGRRQFAMEQRRRRWFFVFLRERREKEEMVAFGDGCVMFWTS